MKYSKSLLNKLEDIFSESDYILRYEKGNFKSGYCILKDKRVVIVNKYFTLDGKINTLLDILKSLNLNLDGLSEKNRKLMTDLNQTSLEF